jgi:transposase InsO family protein
MERFIRTLKEQCLYLHRFTSLEESRQIIGDFIVRYNTAWLIERLGYQTPAEARTAAWAPRGSHRAQFLSKEPGAVQVREVALGRSVRF